LNCCSIIYFVSGDRSIYLRLLLVVYWFLCLYVVLHKSWWVLVGWNLFRWWRREGWRVENVGREQLYMVDFKDGVKK